MKIFICAAGSGGHIYPAISLAERLKRDRPDLNIEFITNSKSISQNIFKQNDYCVHTVDFASPYTNKKANPIKFCLKNLGFLLKFNKEALKVFFMLKKSKPDIVIGFGGVDSIAAILLAKFFRIPTLIHEQNIIPGLANKLVGKITDKTAIGFKQTRKYFSKKAVFTGNPIRPDLNIIDKNTACKRLGLDLDRFTIFVFGGSQGAEFINNCFTKAVVSLGPAYRDKLQVIHSTGTRQMSEISEFYKTHDIKAKVFSYCKEMSFPYSAADLVIGRAGAGTINEICFFGKPAIFIPYLHANAHQKANAQFMQEHGAACLLIENELAVKHLAKDIRRILEQPDVVKTMGLKAKELFLPAADEKLMELVFKLLDKRC